MSLLQIHHILSINEAPTQRIMVLALENRYNWSHDRSCMRRVVGIKNTTLGHQQK